MKVKYLIEFTETTTNCDSSDIELLEIRIKLEERLRKFISLSGVNIEDFKLNLEMVEEE